MASLNLKFKDYSNEASTVALQAADPTDGTDFEALLAAQTAAIANISSLSIGSLVQRGLTAYIAKLNTALPTNPYAHREIKWFIPMRHVDGTPAEFTIPVAKLVGAGSVPLVIAGSDLANMSAAEWAAFTTWLNADNVFFPGYTLDGTPYVVGRNI